MCKNLHGLTQISYVQNMVNKNPYMNTALALKYQRTKFFKEQKHKFRHLIWT